MKFKFEYTDGSTKELELNTYQDAVDFAHLDGDHVECFYTVITVKDLLDYINSEFSLDAEVYLDKDGWGDEWVRPKNVKELIAQSGVFTKFENCMFINN